VGRNDESKTGWRSKGGQLQGCHEGRAKEKDQRRIFPLAAHTLPDQGGGKGVGDASWPKRGSGAKKNCFVARQEFRLGIGRRANWFPTVVISKKGKGRGGDQSGSQFFTVPEKEGGAHRRAIGGMCDIKPRQTRDEVSNSAHCQKKRKERELSATDIKRTKKKCLCYRPPPVLLAGFERSCDN